jgi:hypothetical protein
MNQVREILRTQFVGAITIGFLLAQGIEGLIGVAIDPLAWYLLQSKQFDRYVQPTPFSWPELGIVFVRALLYLLASFALTVWLYWAPKVKQEVSDELE